MSTSRIAVVVPGYRGKDLARDLNTFGATPAQRTGRVCERRERLNAGQTCGPRAARREIAGDNGLAEVGCDA